MQPKLLPLLILELLQLLLLLVLVLLLPACALHLAVAPLAAAVVLCCLAV